MQARLLFVQQEDQALARQLAEQSLAHFRQLGNNPFRAFPLFLLGLIQLEQGELEAARPLLEDSLAIGKQAGAVTEGALRPVLALARLSAREGGAAGGRRLYPGGVTLRVGGQVYPWGGAANPEGPASPPAREGR